MSPASCSNQTRCMVPFIDFYIMYSLQSYCIGIVRKSSFYLRWECAFLRKPWWGSRLPWATTRSSHGLTEGIFHSWHTVCDRSDSVSHMIKLLAFPLYSAIRCNTPFIDSITMLFAFGGRPQKAATKDENRSMQHSKIYLTQLLLLDWTVL